MRALNRLGGRWPSLPLRSCPRHGRQDPIIPPSRTRLSSTSSFGGHPSLTGRSGSGTASQDGPGQAATGSGVSTASSSGGPSASEQPEVSAEALPSLGQQFRDVFRRRSGRVHASSGPESPLLPGFVPLAEGVTAGPRRDLLRTFSKLLSSVDPRAHAFRIGGYQAPSDEIWEAVQDLHARGLFLLLHPNSFAKLIRVCHPHSWAAPTSPGAFSASDDAYTASARAERSFSPFASSKEEASTDPRYFDGTAVHKRRGPAETAHKRVMFLLDRAFERDVPLSTDQLKACRTAALEHHADWGFFAGAEVIWDVFARPLRTSVEGMEADDRHARSLMLACASREVQDRMWMRGPDVKGILFRPNRWKRQPTREVKRIVKRAEQVLWECRDPIPMLGLRSLAHVYAATADEAKLEQLCRKVWGVELTAIDAGKRPTDPGMVNAALRMYRARGELGRMMALFESVRTPLPLPAPSPPEKVGFFDSGAPSKAPIVEQAREGGWQDVALTSRSFREMIGAARDRNDFCLGLHYVSAARHDYLLYVSRLYSLFNPLKPPPSPAELIRPGDVPSAKLKLSPEHWRELEPWTTWQRRWLVQLLSVVRGVQGLQRRELKWYAAYARCLLADGKGDPRWREVQDLAEKALDPRWERGEIDRATQERDAAHVAPRALMVDESGRGSTSSSVVRAKARVGFLAAAMPATYDWLQRNDVDGQILYARQRLYKAEQSWRRAVAKRPSSVSSTATGGKEAWSQQREEKDLERKVRKRLRDMVTARMAKHRVMGRLASGRGGEERRSRYRMMAREQRRKADEARLRWEGMRRTNEDVRATNVGLKKWMDTQREKEAALAPVAEEEPVTKAGGEARV